jgi:ABC-type oligopeptide transport system ATPase subunit
VQYCRFISRAVQGDFSRSVRFNRPALAIAHDLAVVKYVSQQIGVMSLGKLVETAASTELHAHLLHPYTQVLLSNALPSQ